MICLKTEDCVPDVMDCDDPEINEIPQGRKRRSIMVESARLSRNANSDNLIDMNSDVMKISHNCPVNQVKERVGDVHICVSERSGGSTMNIEIGIVFLIFILSF